MDDHSADTTTDTITHSIILVLVHVMTEGNGEDDEEKRMER
jgi:hypothetical protein